MPSDDSSVRLWAYVTDALTCPLTVSSVVDAESKSARPPRGLCSRSRRRRDTSDRGQVSVCLRNRASHCTQPGSPAWDTKLYLGLAEHLRERNEKDNNKGGVVCVLKYASIMLQQQRRCSKSISLACKIHFLTGIFHWGLLTFPTLSRGTMTVCQLSILEMPSITNHFYTARLILANISFTRVCSRMKEVQTETVEEEYPTTSAVWISSLSFWHLCNGVT